jgi:DNA mismatch repair protein MutL
MRLPDEVAERIAAGEVVERPTSVVRELLDNALDAGASQVTVELRGGGLELIRVSDDGWGIPSGDVELAFERHATSKIASSDDLARLVTLGFRGEALPSIGAVAEVTMLTSVDDGGAGTIIVVRGGTVTRQGRAARQRGTTVTVRHLFQNVPARLKFLPAGRAESLLAGKLVRRYALAHPAVRLGLMIDGHSSFQSSGSGRLERALGEVYGPSVVQAMLALPPADVEGATISGYISGQAATRPGRHHLTLLINRRWAGNRELLSALEAAYRPYLPRGRHPIAAITIEVPPHEVDPNVHPSKSEVRLRREREIGEALAQSVREALGRTPTRASEIEDFSLLAPQYQLQSRRQQLAETRGPAWRSGDDDADAVAAALRSPRIVGQVHETLIVAEGPRGLLLIDQHRAHERVIFERLLGRDGGPAQAQGLLEPIVLELSPQRAALLDQRLDHLEALGFTCERFGRHDYLVRAIPSDLVGDDVLPYLRDMLYEAASAEEGWRERLLIASSCRAAIKRNRPLVETDMEALVRDLAATPTPVACPHGSPLILELSGSFLERQFGW